MASGRDMSSSVLRSSDVIHDFSCTPCSEDGKNTEAVSFCVNCHTYFCEPCVGLHNKLLKSHNLLDQATMKAGSRTQSGTTAILPTDFCINHPGNVIQMYCGEHDLVCCTVCIAIDHRACKGVDFIPKVAKGILKGHVRNETKTALDAVYKDLQQLKFEKSKELSELNDRRGYILKEIQKCKEQILARVDTLEKKSVTDVHAKHKEIADHIKSEIKRIDELLQATTGQVDTINKFSGRNEAQLFVSIKHGQKAITKTKDLMQELKPVCSRTISFEFVSQLETFLGDIDSFGSVFDNSNRFNTASLIGEYDCKSSDDATDCLSFGTCVLDDGHILLTDYNNQKLKRLDYMYTVTDFCKIDRPFGVCKTRLKEVAVSSLDSGKIWFVSVGQKLLPTRTIRVGGQCMGIACSKDELFVVCGSYCRSCNTINVYNLNGLLLRTIEQASALAHLSVNQDGTQIFAADINHGLVFLDRKGSKLSSPLDPRLKSGHGVCHDIYGNSFICSEKGNSMIQINRQGFVAQEMLSVSNGIKKPVSVTFAQAPPRLIITSRYKAMQVFRLK